MDDEGGRSTFREKLVRGGKFHGFIDHTNFRLEPYRTEEYWKKIYSGWRFLPENADLEFVHYNHELCKFTVIF